MFCKACPLGSTSDVGAISIDECYCAIGFYGTPGNCRPCPNKGLWGEMHKWTYCVEANLRVPLPQPGFYVVQADNPLEEPVAMRQCFPDVSCPGLKVSARDSAVDAVAAGDWRADEAQCDAGYTNEGCDTCVDGYFRLNSRCEACPPLWQPYLYGLFMVALLLFAVLGPWFIAESSSTYIIVVSLMNVISYSQEIAVFGRYYLHWDDSPRMRAILKWAFLFQLNPEILALECTQNVDFVKRWRSMMLLPAVIGLLIAAALAAYFVFTGKEKVMAATNTLPIRRLQKMWVGVMRSVISLATVMYAGLTVATLDMFVFHVSVTDGREYLRAAPALRFGLMRADEPWYQLLPGAVFALITYCMGILLALAVTFLYCSQKWRKLWVRELVGWSSYAYRDETCWFRVVEMLRFLLFAALQMVALRHDEAGGVSQALSGLLVVALSMGLLLTRPYKRYRKKLLEFVVLFSHGLALLMSSLSLAPTTTEITAGVKASFRDYVFGIVCATYFVILVDVLWSVVEELPQTQRLEMWLRRTFKETAARLGAYVGAFKSVEKWATTPEFDEDAPVKSVFAPSAAAVLERMANTENGPESDWTKEDRCAFARSFKSLLCHRLINERLQRRDLGGVAAYRDLLQPQIRAAMLASAALEDTEHNRLVMAFTEKRLLRVMQMTHRKFYKRVQKKLTTENALNPLLERWLRCECDGLDDDDAFNAFFDELAVEPGPVTESFEMRDVLELEAPEASDASCARAVTESAEKPRRSLRGGSGGSAKSGLGQRASLASGASTKSSRRLATKLSAKSTSRGFFANLDNVNIGKPSGEAPLRVDPKTGARFARGAEAESDDVVDLQFEADIWNARDYEGRVYFLRNEGFFDDLHREWDKHDDAEQAKKDLKELADDPEGAGDVEGGAVLPWHFKDAEREDDDEIAPDEILVPEEPDPEPEDPSLTPAQREERREARREVIERERVIREQTRVRHACCIHLHMPGEVCSHGNVMPDPEVITELIER